MPTSLILLGGKSSRMGRDKALIECPDGRRQIDRLVDLARLAGGGVMLSMRDGSPPPPLDLPVIVDTHRDAGPLAALAAFHERHPSAAALVLSCDLFLLDAGTVEQILGDRDRSRMATCFANRLDGRPEPLCAIYESPALGRASGWITRGERGARHFLRSLEPRVLTLESPAALDNANTPEELAECFSKWRLGVSEKSVRVNFPESGGETMRTLANTVGGLFAEIRFLRRLPKDLACPAATRNGVPCHGGEPVGNGDEIGFLMPLADS